MGDLEELCQSRVFVLDTTSFLAALPLQLYNEMLIAPTSVLREVRDKNSKYRLETTLLIRRVKIKEPKRKYIRIARRTINRIGEATLSETDIDVLALALEYRDKCDSKVIVVTDDYALQNILAQIGVSFSPLRTRGIKEVRRYIVVCPACGYQAESVDEKVCPVCGARLVKKQLRSDAATRMK